MVSRSPRNSRATGPARMTAIAVAATALVVPGLVVGAGSALAAPPAITAAASKSTITIGSSGPAVTLVQQKLGVQPATGYFGVLTAAAVTTYQRTHGIPATGVVATLTWASLSGIGLPAHAGVGGHPTLTFGMTNPAVSTLQRALGMPIVSGYFGPLTLRYVKALQRASGLRAAGVVGPKTWRRVGKVRFAPPAAPVSTASSAAAQSTTGSSVSRVMQIAASLQGIPYVANGYDPAHGFNCSSYTQWVYAQIGVDLGGAFTVTQYERALKISRAEAQPGDLIFFYNYPEKFLGHVGIYAGNDMFWHAPRTGRVISLDKIYSPEVLFARVV